MKHASSLAIAAALAFSSFAPGAALAAGSSKAAWVSGHGTNTAGCGSLTNPCLTLQYTHDNVVAAGGLIAVLDSSDYGPLVIRNAISIVDDGGLAGIAVASGDAIDIQAGPTDAVFLKGLHIDGLGTANNGINLTSAGSLTVANCTIKGFSINNGTGNIGNAIWINTSSAKASFGISDTVLSGNVIGVLVNPSSGNVRFTISDTVISGNSYYGVSVFPSLANNASGATASVNGTITRVEVSRNENGLYVSGGATNGKLTITANQVNASENVGSGFNVYEASLYLTRTTATGNGYGVYNNGVAYSYGDNAINGNANDLYGGLSTIAHLQ